MAFDWNGLLGQFQPSQRVCTPCKRCKIDAQEKLFVLTTFSRFIGLCRVCVMQYMELSDKKLTKPRPSKISVHSGVTLFMFFVCVRVCVCIYMCVTFFLTENREAACFTGDYINKQIFLHHITNIVIRKYNLIFFICIVSPLCCQYRVYRVAS